MAGNFSNPKHLNDLSLISMSILTKYDFLNVLIVKRSLFNTVHLRSFLDKYGIVFHCFETTISVCTITECNRRVGCNRTPVFGQLKQPIILSPLS